MNARACLLAAFAALLSSCSLFLGTPAAGANSDGPVVTRVPFTGDFAYDVDTGSTARDVYFVFSASADKTTYDQPSVTLSVDGTVLPLPAAPKMPKEYGASATALEHIADMSRTLLSSVRIGNVSAVANSVVTTNIDPQFYIVGSDPYNFADINLSGTIASTCQYDSGLIAVDSDGGTRRLVIWVEDAQWYTYATPGPVTPGMVSSLAAKFLSANSNNDIYDWLTAILGPEWGNTGYSQFIPATGEIHILLSDIGGDNNPSSGVIGYFHPINNYTNSALSGTLNAGKSAERLMFVVDSVMFANDSSGSGSTWSPMAICLKKCIQPWPTNFST